MGRLSVEPSKAIAQLLREQRQQRGWTLRDVENRSRSLGRPIPFTTLAKVEQGKVDPGLRRLNVLLKLYDLSPRLALDVVDLEEFSTDTPANASLTTLHEDALRAWRAGDLRTGFTLLAALRGRTSDPSTDRGTRQKALLSVAIAVGSLGRYRLSRHILEELLVEPPDKELLVPVLVQTAVCWHWLGSGETALGFLARAQANTGRDDHKQNAWIAHEWAGTLVSMACLDEGDEMLTRAIGEYEAADDAYGACQALGVRVRLRCERGDFAGALAAARLARRKAELGGFGRLALLRLLDEGNVLSRLGNRDEGLAVLHDGLARAIATQDQVAQFHAHRNLWKAFDLGKDAERANVELGAARYFVQFIDSATPEAKEIRGLADPRHAART